ncbi:MAG: superoxide dismutase [Ni], partial [Planctomycetota bacterium]
MPPADIVSLGRFATMGTVDGGVEIAISDAPAVFPRGRSKLVIDFGNGFYFQSQRRNMLRKLILTAVTLSTTVFMTGVASAHCQVPCGIYGDQRRFEQMLEDEHTISKSQTEMGKLMQSTPQNVNQATRWVMTKEEHAGRIQSIWSRLQ